MFKIKALTSASARSAVLLSDLELTMNFQLTKMDHHARLAKMYVVSYICFHLSTVVQIAFKNTPCNDAFFITFKMENVS